MPISSEYQDTLRRRAVQRFVSENSRAPTVAELEKLIKDEQRNYPTVDTVGIAGFDMARPRFQDPSSVQLENKNRHAVFDDLVTADKRLDNLIQLLEDSYRGFYSNSRRVGRLLDQVESRLDNLLLLNGQTEVFVVGVEETFDSQQFVDHAASSAQVESGYVTLGRTGYQAIDLSQAKITATNGGTISIVGTVANSPLESLKEDDGNIWEYVVYTQEQQGRISLILNVEMPEPTYVGNVRLSGVPVSVNKKMLVSCFYSLDGESFRALEPVEQIATPEMDFQIGLDGVQEIQFMFSKAAADSTTDGRGRFMYVFSIDSLKVFADKFNVLKTSELVCGPYEVIDEEGLPVYFTKAAIQACVNEPEDTSISFYISKDKETWIPVDHEGRSSNYVSFGDGTFSQAAQFLDATASAGTLVETVTGMENIDFSSEALINTYIDVDYVDQVPLRSVEVRRNITNPSITSLLKSVPGWVYDENTQQYSTTLYVENPQGRYLDLGGTSAQINGRTVTGEVYISPGYVTFATSDSNWIEIDTGITTVESLKQKDPLYPYNHKYLVEGYAYPASYVGEQIYTGVDSIFGSLMVYRSPEEFAYLESGDPLFYNVFTVEEVDGNRYIKVKVNKTDASWKDELFAVDWTVQSSETNLLYVRALFNTSDEGQTPRLDSFKVRVI